MKPAPRQYDRKTRRCNADRNLVEADTVFAACTNAHIARQQEKRSHRESMALHDPDRRGEDDDGAR